MKTAMNKPLSQGATATGRPARSEEQALLWALTFMVREAVLVAPDNMEKRKLCITLMGCTSIWYVYYLFYSTFFSQYLCRNQSGSAFEMHCPTLRRESPIYFLVLLISGFLKIDMYLDVGKKKISFRRFT